MVENRIARSDSQALRACLNRGRSSSATMLCSSLRLTQASAGLRHGPSYPVKLNGSRAMIVRGMQRWLGPASSVSRRLEGGLRLGPTEGAGLCAQTRRFTTSTTWRRGDDKGTESSQKPGAQVGADSRYALNVLRRTWPTGSSGARDSGGLGRWCHYLLLDEASFYPGDPQVNWGMKGFRSVICTVPAWEADLQEQLRFSQT